MSDLISRQDAIDALQNEYCPFCEQERTIRKRLESLPSAERKGKWIEDHEPFTWMGYARWHCSYCGFKCGYEQEIRNRTNFCPDCGARMER